MSMRLQVDTREFDRALMQYVLTTSKTLADAINHKAGQVAFRAYSLTPKGDRNKIAAELGATYEAVIGKRGKALKRKKLAVATDGRARALLIAQLKRRGILRSAKDVSAMVSRFVSKRVSSVSFFRAGWIPAIRALAKGAMFERRRGRPTGRATRAKDSLSPVAEIENNSTPPERVQMPAVSAFMEKALGSAFRQETADMEQYIARKAQQAANTVNPPSAKP